MSRKYLKTYLQKDNTASYSLWKPNETLWDLFKALGCTKRELKSRSLEDINFILKIYGILPIEEC